MGYMGGRRALHRRRGLWVRRCRGCVRWEQCRPVRKLHFIQHLHQAFFVLRGWVRKFLATSVQIRTLAGSKSIVQHRPFRSSCSLRPFSPRFHYLFRVVYIQTLLQHVASAMAIGLDNRDGCQTVGLVNEDSRCYINAVMQCLFHCRCFVREATHVVSIASVFRS